MYRRVVKTLALVLLAVTMALPAYSASATSEYWSDGYVTTTPSWERYYTERSVYEDPYGIGFLKDDGPGLEMRYWDCGRYGYGTSSIVAQIPNDDPAPYWSYLKYNGSQPYSLRFCLQIRDTSGGGTDTFRGTFDWDGGY